MASLHQVGDGTSGPNAEIRFDKDAEPGSTEEWCDSGLGFFSGTELSIADDIETDSSCCYFTAAPPLTYTAAAEHEIWGPQDFGAPGDGGESCLPVWGSGERLDSAVGDSITEETAAEMGGITDGIVAIDLRDTANNNNNIMHLASNDPDSGNTAAQPPQEQRCGNLQQVREEMLKTLAFISEDGDTRKDWAGSWTEPSSPSACRALKRPLCEQKKQRRREAQNETQRRILQETGTWCLETGTEVKVEATVKGEERADR